VPSRNTRKRTLKVSQAVTYLFLEYKAKVIKGRIKHAQFYVCFTALFNYVDNSFWVSRGFSKAGHCSEPWRCM